MVEIEEAEKLPTELTLTEAKGREEYYPSKEASKCYINHGISEDCRCGGGVHKWVDEEEGNSICGLNVGPLKT